MADLKRKTADINDTLKDQAIRGKEHLAAKQLEQPRPLSVQSLRAVAMAGPVARRVNLFSNSSVLQIQLYAWNPSGPDADKKLEIAQRLNMELNMRDAVLIQERYLQSAEAGMSVVPQMLTDISSPSAPSMEKLDEALKALEVYESTLPPPLAAALRNFRKEFSTYVS